MTPKRKSAPVRHPAASRNRLAILPAWLKLQVATLYPGSFALVMATGIISNALFFEGRRELSDALFAVNVIAYPWLLAATFIRACLLYTSDAPDDLLCVDL